MPTKALPRVNQRGEANACGRSRAGLIAGFPDGTFRPTRVLTRAEGVTLLLRVLALRQGGLA